MKISVLAVGKCKERYWREAIDEYCKRLSRYAQIEIIEVADEKTPDEAGEKENRRIRDKEGERLLARIREEAYCIALAIDGEMTDSEGFSRDLDRLAVSGKSHIQFVIGGSLGLSEEVLKRADRRLSFGKMTYPHQMMRVILLEQIYRAFRISRGEPYHK